MNSIRLISLDLDGTLFNEHSLVTEGSRAAIRAAVDAGVYATVCTGRPLCGVPVKQLEGTGIRHAITTNGGGIYELDTGKCLYESSMDTDFILPIIKHLLTFDIHLDAFINGKAYSQISTLQTAYKLDMPPNLLEYVIHTRKRVEDLCDFILQNQLNVQKITMNFYPDANGTLVDRDAVLSYLRSIPEISCVSGGYNNLEFTKAGVSKGNSLGILADLLGVPIEQTMAVGDTENDLSVIKAAGLGVAMGNATPEVKAAADCITLSNEEDGVAHAIYTYVLNSNALNFSHHSQ